MHISCYPNDYFTVNRQFKYDKGAETLKCLQYNANEYAFRHQNNVLNLSTKNNELLLKVVIKILD